MVVPDSTQQLLAAEREALAKAEKERDIALRDADRPAACLMLARCVKKGLGYELGKMKERAEKAEKERDELRGQVKALREALLKAEWEGPLTYSDGRGCPVCHQGKPRRHTEQCKLSLALAATAEERP